MLAYRIQPFQISKGGPTWFDSVHYDITAKSEKSAQTTTMIPLTVRWRFSRTGFDWRFITSRKSSLSMPSFWRGRTASWAPILPNQKPGSCTAIDPIRPPPPPKPGEPPLLGCGGMMTGLDRLRAVGALVAGLESLSQDSGGGRIVVDKTGLTGTYDMRVEWTLDDNQLANTTPPGAPRPTVPDNAGPSIFTALQQQLGLKLESQKWTGGGSGDRSSWRSRRRIDGIRKRRATSRARVPGTFGPLPWRKHSSVTAREPQADAWGWKATRSPCCRASPWSTT